MDVMLFILGIFLTVVPLIELRGGIPLVVIALRDSNPTWSFFAFLLVTLINVILIFLIFLFLETLHYKLLKFRFYKKNFDRYLLKIRKKSKKISNKRGIWVFISLFLFVAVPLPLTGAYTGTVIAWFLDLNKKKSIMAISLGVLVAGILVFLTTKGVIELI
jgi:uncharacterized membrane protein